ncbi:hypothetical protein EGH21_08305 [Halomicroarcula sp. F13]|uniref:Uncharacterized protein n=1 Tax=Haloarcula rubra TaxID=2487747 RepID=A0AAW4PQN2_9EURY|nr:hypothetical protein [Halomicroarcula rubra]MBX0323026.1 hypothetical protein [Halomicroarcula rubra]
MTKEEETQRSQKLMAGLKVFLKSGVEGQKQERKNVMKSVNQSEEHIQSKKVVNDLLQDDSIPRIKDLDLDNISPLYRFSCECQFLSTETEMGDSKMVEVVGKEGDFKFRGITSLENWSSLSDTLYAVKNEIPYPLDGIVQLKNINNQMIREDEDGGRALERADCDVNFVFISQSDPDEVQKWWNRRDLLGEYYEKQAHSKS